MGFKQLYMASIRGCSGLFSDASRILQGFMEVLQGAVKAFVQALERFQRGGDYDLSFRK